MDVSSRLPRNAFSSIYSSAHSVSNRRRQQIDAEWAKIFYEPPTRIARVNAIEIFVHKDDEEKAREIIDELNQMI